MHACVFVCLFVYLFVVQSHVTSVTHYKLTYTSIITLSIITILPVMKKWRKKRIICMIINFVRVSIVVHFMLLLIIITVLFCIPSLSDVEYTQGDASCQMKTTQIINFA